MAVARSLGRHGVPVWLFTNDQPIARFSRYVRCGPKWPDKGDEKIEVLMETALRHGLKGWTLFAGSDIEAQFLAQYHTILSDAFLTTTPAWNVMRWAYDKRLTYRLAAEAGIDLPWTYSPRDRDDVASLKGPFPMVVKPAIKEHKNRFIRDKAWRANDRKELMARYDEASSLVDPGIIILQELIPGSGSTQFSYAALWSKRGPVASLVARRLRQYPIDFGYTSTFVETVEQPEVSQAAERFLRAINYSGLVEVEFKYDVRERRYKLLDVNGRLWTWNALGNRAGVDFAYLMWLESQGKSVPPCQARTGVGWLHASRDFVAAMLEIQRGTLSTTAYLRSLCGPKEFASFAMDDPLPTILGLPLLAIRLIQRMRG
jgi:predicted ATP-grasp superfamily ATP-dependent carboligase